MRSITIFFTAIALLLSCREEEKNANVETEIQDLQGHLMPGIVAVGDSIPYYELRERMEHYNVPGVSIAVVQNGAVRWAKGYGLANTETGTPIDTLTLFQAGSISKPLAALAALRLWEQGKVDLDADVNTYLTDWKLPDNRFTDSARVSLRLLLTHSAGITVHGFPGYSQTDSFPSIEDVLNGKGNTDPIRVDTIPGSLWRYSGGGYTIMEKVVEDISGLPLEVYMEKEIFPALEMRNSTYQQPLPASLAGNASAAYNGAGELLGGLWHNYPEQAAAGLWTTPADLARYCIAIQGILAGHRERPIGKSTAEAMLTKHLGDWGLGPALYREADSLLFGHGGKNEGFTNNMMASAYQGNAVIVMTNADRGGDLMMEIMRGVSDYYQWGILKPRKVERTEVSKDSLQRFAGSYLLDFEVPEVGGAYKIQMSIEEDRLFVSDPNNGEEQWFDPTAEGIYIDMESADELKFAEIDGRLEALFNNFYRFTRLADSEPDARE